MWNGSYKLSESTAARRRVYFHLVDATDGITAEVGEAAGQPQLSKNGAAFANTTATLASVGNGRYYVELTAAELDTLGSIQLRYKSAATAEGIAGGQVVAFDPYDSVRMGLSAIPNATAGASGGVLINGSNSGAVTLGSGVTISNASGNALTLTASGGNGHGLASTGNGTGSGISATGGATASGIIGQSGATSGAGLQLSGVGSSPGLDIAGGPTGPGISAVGSGSAAGIYASSNGTGQGMDLLGGVTSGEGLRVRSNSGNAITATASAGNGHGLVVTGQGAGAGLRAVAGATGIGAIFVGGSTSGEGFTVSSTSGNGASFTAGGGNGHGFVTTGQGSGEGFRAVGGAAGNGFEGVAGATAGDGIKGTAPVGIPINTGLLSGLVAAGSTSTTIKLAAGPATNDIFNGTLAILATGAGAGQCRLISDYEGATATCTVTPAWTVTPALNDVFEIVHWGTTQAEPMTTPVQHSDTAQAGAAATITLAATASAINDLYNGQFIKLYDGTGAGQSRAIIDYDGTTKVATVDRAWITNPTSASKYSIMAGNVPALDATLLGVLLSADAVTAAAIATGAIDADAIATGAIDADALSADAGTEISDAVWAKAMTELAAVPGVTGTVLQALEWLFLLARNKRTTTASLETLKKDDTTTNLATAAVADDGTTFSREEWA